MLRFLSFSMFAVALALGDAVAPSTRPHLLFMMADQLRWDALSHAAGPDNKAFRTPALDRLAREGLRVKFGYSSTPTCTPARAALLTGKSPWGHGMLGLAGVAHKYPVEMPRVLASAGYRTRVIGKNHFNTVPHGYENSTLYDGLGKWSPSKPHKWAGEWDDYDQWFARELPSQDPQATLDGFDGDGWNTWHGRAYIYNESLHPTAWVGRAAVEFIRSYPNASESVQPFLLKVSFHRPHSPYDPPQRLLDTVNEADLRPMRLCTAPGKWTPESDGQGDGWCSRFRGGAGFPRGCGNSSDAWCGEMPVDEQVLGRRAYAASVNFVDEWVGKIYEALVERRLLEHTWIIWTADHGDGQGDMFHWRKGYPYEFSAHVPMLLRWPASWKESVVPRGTVLDAPIVAELRDVFHTFVDAAGVSGNASLINASSFSTEDGRSMLCLLRDPTGLQHCDYAPNPGPWRRYLDLEHSTCYNETNHWSALTDGHMKYIFRAWFGQEQLFNLTADPHETAELSGRPDYATELAIWRQRMVEQFEGEGRGEDWVRNGTLVRRTKNQATGRNYPRKQDRRSNDSVRLEGPTGPPALGSDALFV